MVVTLDMEIQGHKQYMRTLKKLEKSFSDYRRPLRAIAEDVRDFESERFKKQNWTSLSDLTIRMRTLRVGYYKKSPTGNPGILIWTGRLRDSLSVRDAPGNIEKVTKDSLLIGSNLKVEQPAIHNVGMGHIPKREIYPLERIADIAEFVMGEFLDELIEELD